MTERNLIALGRKVSPLQWASLGAALILLVFVAVWLTRLTIATSYLRSVCADRELTCTFKIARLDFGGVTFTDLKVAGADPATFPFSAERIAVDLSWSSPFSTRPAWVGGEGVAVRIDLRGGPLLGDLDRVLKSLPERDPDAPAGPMPRLAFNNIKVIAETVLGPVEAAGRLAATSASDFALELIARPVRLASGGAELDLVAAEIRAAATGGSLTGLVNIDLARFAAPGASIEDVRIALAVDQLDGRLTGSGAASALEVALAEGEIRSASARADFESAAVELGALTPEALLTRISKLTLTGSAGAGSVSGAGWEKGELAARLDPRASGGASGDVTFVVDGLEHAAGSAERLEIGGRLDLPSGISSASGRALNAVGTARLQGARLSAETSGELGEAVEGPLKALLPQFAAAARRTVRRAGEAFELVLPWSFRLDDGGFDASALTGSTLKSASGFAGVSEGAAGGAVFTYSVRDAPAWAAAGTLSVSGGGGPQLALAVTKASGGENGLAVAGEAEILSLIHI